MSIKFILFRHLITDISTINSKIFTVQPIKTTIRSFRKTPYPIPQETYATRDSRPLQAQPKTAQFAPSTPPLGTDHLSLVLVIKNEAIAFPIPWIDSRSSSVTSFNFFLSLVTSFKHLSVRLFEGNPYPTRNK